MEAWTTENNISRIQNWWPKKKEDHDSVNAYESFKQTVEQLEMTWKLLNQLKRNQENEKESHGQYTLDLEALERSWLESSNFKVDSSNWEKWEDVNGIKYFINPERDIWEIILPDGTTEQLFTQVAAIRETQKVWKKLPTKEQLERLCEVFWQNWEKISKGLWLPIRGYWSQSDNLYYRDAWGHYWLSSSNNSTGRSLHFNKNFIFIKVVNSTKNAFPVRCIRN